MKNYNDMALALAGVCQSVLLISQLAQKGEVDNQDAFQTTIHSLLITQPEDTLAVFGGDVQHLKVGLNTLIEQLTQLNDKNLLNYWGSLLALESKLNKQPEIVQDKIRACLLAGIRSAVLWRQVGGSKWQLLFHRKKLVQAARQLYLTLN